MCVLQIKRDGKATWRTEGFMHMAVPEFPTRRCEWVFGKPCLSVDGAELPDHSGTSFKIVPEPCGMV